ncbi:MAG: hypothetical protein INR63_16225, partial [Actinomycetospora chiangmaiensis]|nr:hypothetical protein [Actinomycetospora chiangmaiensis]
MAPPRLARSLAAALGAGLVGSALAILPPRAQEQTAGGPRPADAVEAMDVITPVPS